MKRRHVILWLTACSVALLLALLTAGMALAAPQAPVNTFTKTTLVGSQPWVNGTIHYQVALGLDSTAFGDVVLKDDFLYGIDFVPGTFKINGTPVTAGPGIEPNPKLISSIATRKSYAFWLGKDLAPGNATITFDAKVGPAAPPWQYVSNSANLYIAGAWKGSSKVNTNLSETVPLVQKDPSNWEPVAGGASGTLKHVFGGPTFKFMFAASKLKPNTKYSLIYYADPWPGNHPGALIATGTSNGSGRLGLSGSPNLGLSLPDPADANYPAGAKIWLVPSSDYDAGTNSIKIWNATQWLFEIPLIKYTYAP